MYIESVIDVSRRVLIERGERGDGGAQALKFMNYISDERLIQAAMLADAAHETSQIIRFCDKESWDTAEMVDMLDAWQSRITFLFFEDGVLRTQSFTCFMLKFLQSPRVINFGDKVVTIGSHGGVPDLIIRRCMERMKVWHRLALSVKAAEFPSFEVWGSFGIFKLITGRRPNQDINRDQIERVATSFGLNASLLKAQTEDHVHLAMTIKSKDGVCNGEAWRLAVMRSRGNAEKHPTTELVSALQRYRAYNISTSGLEQSFSMQDSLFGKQADRNLVARQHLLGSKVPLSSRILNFNPDV